MTNRQIGWLGFLVVAIVIAVSFCFARSEPPLKTNNLITNAPSYIPEQPFLTLTNCVLVQIGNTTIIRLSDDNWSLIANRYSAKIVTNTIHFYK